ncbi:MAG TPA: hypothetical protein VI685_10280 [Candidatus Angelobacter sp.]
MAEINLQTTTTFPFAEEHPTTLVVGEEVTTEAIGEEGPTTTSTGEENPSARPADLNGQNGPFGAF